jgi:hypothetical protein
MVIDLLEFGASGKVKFRRVVIVAWILRDVEGNMRKWGIEPF